MRTTTADYKAAIYATDRECRGYIKFNNDGTKIIRGVDGLISITLHEQLCDEERPMMNCACSRYVEVEFFNSGLPGGVSLANSYIDTYMGVVTKDTGTAPVGSIEPDTATVEYIWNGRFLITEIDRGKLSTKVLAYDELSKLNKQYVPTVTKGVNGYAKNDIYVDILTQCGFTNTLGGLSGYVQDLYDCTCRQMVGWLLGSVTLGCNVRMSRTNAVNVASTTLATQWGYRDNADHEITDNEIYLGGLADGDTFTVSSVTTGTADNPIVVGSGTGIVGENPYLTQANATTIYNNVNGITFKPMTIEFRGNPAIDTCDVLKVTSGGTSNYCYVQRLTTTFNGGIKQKIECFGDSEFYYSTELSPTTSQIKNAVSTMAQEIQQEIETADNGVITKILDLDGSWKELVIANNQDLSAATSVWRWNINGLAHSTAYSGGTYNFAVDMNGRIIANAIQTGILTDALGKNSWNLDTGALTITDGSINISTTSLTNDVIQLAYSNALMRLSPSSLNFKIGATNRTFQISASIPGLRWFDDDGGIAGVNAGQIYSGGKGYGGLDGSFVVFNTAGTQRSNLGINGVTLADSNGVPTAHYHYDGITLFESGSFTSRARLTYGGGLVFKDASNTVTASYPATGLPMLNGAADNTTQTGAVIAVPYVTHSTLGITTSATDFEVSKAWAKYVAAQYPNKQYCVFIGTVSAGHVRNAQMMAYDTSNTNADGIPNVCNVQLSRYSGGIYYYTCESGTYKRVAFLDQSSLRFLDSNGYATASYPADPTTFLKDNGLSVASLKDCTSETASTSGTTKTYTLTNGTYLITTAKYNNSSTANDGVWLASVYTGGTSHLSALLAPTGTTTVSISGATLTVVTGTNNERITITHLNF